MKKIELKATNHFPKVVLDPEGYVLLEGRSIVPNPTEFYVPIIEWIKEYTSSNSALTFDFKVEYFNTASSKMIIQILLTLKEAENNGFHTDFNWYYVEDDDDMLETAQEAELLTQLKINYFSVD